MMGTYINTIVSDIRILQDNDYPLPVSITTTYTFAATSIH